MQVPDPDIVVELDADGSAVLSLETLRRSPGDPGRVDTNVVIVRLTVDDAWGYALLPVYALNMHRVRGHGDLADDTIEMEVQ